MEQNFLYTSLIIIGLPITLLIGVVFTKQLLTTNIQPPLVNTLTQRDINELTRINDVMLTKLNDATYTSAWEDATILGKFFDSSSAKALIHQIELLDEKHLILSSQDLTILKAINVLLNKTNSLLFEFSLDKLKALGENEITLINELTTRVTASFITSTEKYNNDFLKEIVTPDSYYLFEKVINNILFSLENLDSQAQVNLMSYLNINSIEVFNNYIFSLLSEKSLSELALFIYQTKELVSYGPDTLKFSYEKNTLFLEYFPYSSLSIMDIFEKATPSASLPIFPNTDKTMILGENFAGVIRANLKTIVDPELVLGNYHQVLAKWVKYNSPPHFDVNVCSGRFFKNQIHGNEPFMDFTLESFNYSFELLSTLELYPIFHLIC